MSTETTGTVKFKHPSELKQNRTRVLAQAQVDQEAYQIIATAAKKYGVPRARLFEVAIKAYADWLNEPQTTTRV